MKESQRTTEWLELPNMAYHEGQFQEPYRSTVMFSDWLIAQGVLDESRRSRVLDVGAGLGANVAYMGQRFTTSDITGLELNPELVVQGNARLMHAHLSNCQLITGNLYRLNEVCNNEYDGVVSLQTLSWLPEYKAAVGSIASCGAEWIAFSSLFFEGHVSCKIEITDHALNLSDEEPRRTFYNIYSLPEVTETLRRSGYPNVSFIPFEIDRDLPRPTHGGMGTYTEKLESGHRLQRSGPLLMPWYFVLARR
ncbi:MAG: class I SAM-dependent methyltransferase [Gemmatimonadaceae bacterium]